ncbi:MAG: YggS family pyridoxal phosphate-dependent enzyme [Gaiellales bacterium]
MITERYQALSAEVGPEVTVVVATKYVPSDAMDRLLDAGVTTVGENRLQDLEQKHQRWGEHFTWHFIGHLQSRKAPAVSSLVELVHSLDSQGAARRLSVPALVQVNLAGETSKSGVAPSDLEDFVATATAAGVEIRGLTTMPPLTTDPEDSARYFARLASLASALNLTCLSMGTSQDYRVAVREGATHIRVGSALFAR